MLLFLKHWKHRKEVKKVNEASCYNVTLSQAATMYAHFSCKHKNTRAKVVNIACKITTEIKPESFGGVVLY